MLKEIADTMSVYFCSDIDSLILFRNEKESDEFMIMWKFKDTVSRNLKRFEENSSFENDVFPHVVSMIPTHKIQQVKEELNTYITVDMNSVRSLLNIMSVLDSKSDIRHSVHQIPSIVDKIGRMIVFYYLLNAHEVC